MLKHFYKRFILNLVLFFTTGLVAIAQPGSLSTNNLVGSGTYDCSNLTDKGTFRQVRIQAGTSSSSVAWEFPLNCSFPGNVWRPYASGTSAVSFNTIMNPSSSTNSARYNTANGGNPGTFATTTNGRYYTVNIEENTAADNYFQVLETSFNPTSLGSPTVNFTAGKGNYGATNVSFTLPSSLNGSENLFCRYTTNGFSSSTLIQCTVSGTSVNFVIPAQASNASVAFYFYTSTKSLSTLNSDVTSNGQRAHDLNTLELLNNSGSNYTYTQPNTNVLVNSTGGTTTPTGYTTLGAALTAITSGTHTGVITIGIFGNTTETGTTVFPVNGTGSASFSYIGIQPAGGGARTVSATVAGNCYQYGGSSNITINGLNTGGNSITFENTSTGSANTFQLSNDAVNDSFLNMTIKGSSTSSSGGVVAILATTGSTGNDNNVFQYVTFKPSGSNLPLFYIYSNGTSGKENSGNIVDNCLFEDFYHTSSFNGGGLFITSNNTNWNITNNHFYWTSSRAAQSTTLTAINVTNSGVGFNITGNYIGGSGMFCSGSAMAVSGTLVTAKFRGIYISVGSGSISTIARNKINNIKWYTSSGTTGSPGSVTLIYGAGGNLVIGGINGEGNIIGSTSGADSLQFGCSNNGVLYTGITVDASGSGSINAVIKNNNFGAISWYGMSSSASTTSITNSGSFYAINAAGSTSTHTIDSNTIGNSTANNIKFTLACTSSVACVFKGIIQSSGATASISYNTIQNYNNAYVPSSANSSPVFRGIETSGGTNTVVG
ncbi:MAG: hypothetical protein HYZ42_07945, partial [Bacteroidetes bacterium]|nr:hypothetical protein [Bacteroidota bacterium]